MVEREVTTVREICDCAEAWRAMDLPNALQLWQGDQDNRRDDDNILLCSAIESAIADDKLRPKRELT